MLVAVVVWVVLLYMYLCVGLLAVDAFNVILPKCKNVWVRRTILLLWPISLVVLMGWLLWVNYKMIVEDNDD